MILFKKARWPEVSAFLVAGFFFFAFLINPAFAQQDDLGVFIWRLDEATISMPEFMELLAYLMGLFCLYSAVMALKEYSQEPEKKPLKPALIRFIIAAMLIALPQSVRTITNSFGASTMNMPTLTRPSALNFNP